MKLLRPIPRSVGRLLSAVVVLAWLVQMGVLFRSIRASTMNLAGDLSRYGSSAQWKGVYSRGDKIGFMVGQTIPTADGFELQEDGRIQMTLLGATSAAPPCARPSPATRWWWAPPAVPIQAPGRRAAWPRRPPSAWARDAWPSSSGRRPAA